MGILVFFFIQEKDKAICLLCHQSVNTLKSCNLKRHHEQKHEAIVKLNDNARNAKLQSLKADLHAQQQIFQKHNSDSNAVVSASLRISQIIAKKIKQFSDGEYVKECLLAAVEEIAPTKVKGFRQISLSHQTVSRRIHLLRPVSTTSVEKSILCLFY